MYLYINYVHDLYKNVHVLFTQLCITLLYSLKLMCVCVFFMP